MGSAHKEQDPVYSGICERVGCGAPAVVAYTLDAHEHRTCAHHAPFGAQLRAFKPLEQPPTGTPWANADAWGRHGYFRRILPCPKCHTNSLAIDLTTGFENIQNPLRWIPTGCRRCSTNCVVMYPAPVPAPVPSPPDADETLWSLLVSTQTLWNEHIAAAYRNGIHVARGYSGLKHVVVPQALYAVLETSQHRIDRPESLQFDITYSLGAEQTEPYILMTGNPVTDRASNYANRPNAQQSRDIVNQRLAREQADEERRQREVAEMRDRIIQERAQQAQQALVDSAARVQQPLRPEDAGLDPAAVQRASQRRAERLASINRTSGAALPTPPGLPPAETLPYEQIRSQAAGAYRQYLGAPLMPEPYADTPYPCLPQTGQVWASSKTSDKLVIMRTDHDRLHVVFNDHDSTSLLTMATLWADGWKCLGLPNILELGWSNVQVTPEINAYLTDPGNPTIAWRVRSYSSGCYLVVDGRPQEAVSSIRPPTIPMCLIHLGDYITRKYTCRQPEPKKTS